MELIQDNKLFDLIYFKFINVLSVKFYVFGYLNGVELQYDLGCVIIKDEEELDELVD